jgi:Peptidase family M28
MGFDARVALSYARAISRPRRVGCREDEKVAEEIAARLEQFGYRVERQPFQFSTAPAWFLTLEILAGLLLILTTFWVRRFGTWAEALSAAMLLLLMFAIGPINRRVEANSLVPDPNAPVSRWSAMCLQLGSRYTSANLVATRPDLPDDPTLPYLYLVAHYDSKSQWMPLAVRITLFTAAIAGSLSFAGLTLLGFTEPALTFAANVAGIVGMGAGLPLLFLGAGNASPGAIDNASGVGVVLHLAECLARRSNLFDKLRVTVLLTSAEELTLGGAFAFVRRNEGPLLRRAKAGGLYILNLDGPGVDGKLYMVSQENRSPASHASLADLVRAACRELQVPLGKFSLLGAMFDHIPFARCGFDAVSLTAVGQASWAVHTPGDSADKLHVQGFEQAGRAVWRVVEKLATEIL